MPTLDTAAQPWPILAHTASDELTPKLLLFTAGRRCKKLERRVDGNVSTPYLSSRHFRCMCCVCCPLCFRRHSGRRPPGCVCYSACYRRCRRIIQTPSNIFFTAVSYVTKFLFHPAFSGRYFFRALLFARHRCKLTVYRRIQKANQTRAGYVRRTGAEQTYNRKPTATVFKFPVTTSLSESATEVEQQFSASLTYRESRLTVTVKTKPDDPASCAVFCSGRECQP